MGGDWPRESPSEYSPPFLSSMADSDSLAALDFSLQTGEMGLQEGTAVDDSTSIPKTSRKRIRRRGGEGQGRRGRPTRNPCWLFFHRLPDRNVQCQLCSKVVKSACATNMTKHLERHHQPLPFGGGHGPVDSFIGDTVHYDLNADVDFPAPLQDLLDPSLLLGEGGEVSGDSSMAEWPTGFHSLSDCMDAPVGEAKEEWTGTEEEATQRTTIKRNRRTKHPVWELFRRTSSGQAQCLLCNAFVRSPCSSNFMGHLNRHHSEHYQDIYARWLSGRRHLEGLPPCRPPLTPSTSTSLPSTPIASSSLLPSTVPSAMHTPLMPSSHVMFPMDYPPFSYSAPPTVFPCPDAFEGGVGVFPYSLPPAPHPLFVSTTRESPQFPPPFMQSSHLHNRGRNESVELDTRGNVHNQM